MLNSESLLTHSIGDTLGGHLDDMEADWSKPIVSMRYISLPSVFAKRKTV
jgi:hypothetical protein